MRLVTATNVNCACGRRSNGKFLADLLIDRVDAADALESLIAAHAKRLPDDPSLSYYRNKLRIKRTR